MKRTDRIAADGCSRISLWAVVIVALIIFCFGGLFSAGISEAVTYYMRTGTGNLNGITANFGTCVNATAPVIVPMNTSGSTGCTTGRSASTGAVGAQILMLISDTPYTQAMNVTGGDVTGYLRDYQETANPGTQVGIQYQLGYVSNGTFTSFGSADEARDYSTQSYQTTDLSSISGTAPSGSSLALQVIKQNPNATQYRYYFTSTSLVLNVAEAAVASCIRNDPTVSISPSTHNLGEGTSVNYTLTVTNNDTADCAASTFNLSWTNSPGMPNANFSSTGQTATIGPINPASASPTLIFTHATAVGAAAGATQQSYVAVSDASHSAVASNTVTSTVIAAAAAPVGNWPLFFVVFAAMTAYVFIRQRKKLSNQ